jgi:hypothetical protein
MAELSDGGGIDASIAALLVHAGRVQGIADRIGTARQAAQTVMLGSGAYGQLLDFVPTSINTAQAALTSTLATAESSVRDTADRLRRAAQAYDDADVRARQRLGSA